MGAITTDAEANLSKSANFARVREREFVEIFNGDIRKLTEALGITRKIQKESGSVLKVMKVTGSAKDNKYSLSVSDGENVSETLVISFLSCISCVIMCRFKKIIKK